ncbi:MAG TPA: choice-of-anchor tandem repeat GloVer-containing protein [Terriglobales bacterium]
MKICSFRPAAHALIAVAAYLTLATNAWAGPEFKLLHAFDMGKYQGGGLWGSLAIDPEGNLYGTAAGGGTHGYGIVFELTPLPDGHWTETVLHNFNCKEEEGCIPSAGLTIDSSGNLYGMTNIAVFELSPGQSGWTISVLNDQQGGTENLILDQAGNLYAPFGAGEYSQGAISELVKKENWTADTLFSFCSGGYPCADGADPIGAVTWGPGGSLYGTTVWGGSKGYGIVFQLTPQQDGTWKETILHSFPDGANDGRKVYDAVTLDRSGNIYGATAQGGTKNCGSIFKLTHEVTGWKETILHECGSNNLTFDANGNLWGTTPGGGKYGYGTVFELSPQKSGKWKYTVVHQFNGADGASPNAAITFDEQGNLYGTTVLGGPGNSVGVVFEITTTPSPQ